MKYRIFIVEDDETIANLLKKHLSSWGYDVFLAEDFSNILQEFAGKDPQLVLLDLKHIHKTDYEKMTGRSMDRFEEFLNALKKHQTKIWIRHVVVPGITDSEDHMAQLKAYIQTIPNVEKVELLPYHLLGTNKYKVMDIPYSLEGVPAMDKKKTEMLQQTYFDHVYFTEEKSC